jgi:hypothetical protein
MLYLQIVAVRAGYYIRLAVNPQNPDDVLMLNSSFQRSTERATSVGGRPPRVFTLAQTRPEECGQDGRTG